MFQSQTLLNVRGRQRPLGQYPQHLVNRVGDWVGDWVGGLGR